MFSQASKKKGSKLTDKTMEAGPTHGPKQREITLYNAGRSREDKPIEEGLVETLLRKNIAVQDKGASKESEVMKKHH